MAGARLWNARSIFVVFIDCCWLCSCNLSVKPKTVLHCKSLNLFSKNKNNWTIFYTEFFTFLGDSVGSRFSFQEQIGGSVGSRFDFWRFGRFEVQYFKVRPNSSLKDFSTDFWWNLISHYLSISRYGPWWSSTCC